MLAALTVVKRVSTLAELTAVLRAWNSVEQLVASLDCRLVALMASKMVA